MQAAAMQIIYKGVFQWFLKLIVGVQFTDCRFLKKEKQFIILANHNSHLDTLSLLASLPGELFVESQTRSSRRLFRENPLSGFHQQLFHQYASYQKKREKKIRSTIRSVRCLKPSMPGIH